MPISGLPPPAVGSARAAVVVLDLFSTYDFPGGARLLKAIGQRTPLLARLCERARAAKVPVVFVNDNLGHWNSDFPGLLQKCEQRSAEVAALIAQMRPAPGDHVLLKPRHSAFYGTALEALLEHLRTSVIVLAGVSAESCVLATACDAHTRGFRLVLPADTMGGIDRRGVARTLEAVAGAFNVPVPSRAAALRFVKGRLP